MKNPSFRERGIGWHVLEPTPGGYTVPLPRLSLEEERLALLAEEVLRAELGTARVQERGALLAMARAALAKVCARNSIKLVKEQARYLAEFIVSDLCGLCFLEPMLRDPELEEIAVIGVGKPVYVYHSRRGWLKTNCVLTDERRGIELINKLARGLGRRVTLRSPRLNAVLEDGSRLHASAPPLSEVELTIRKFRSEPIGVPELMGSGMFTAESLAYLWCAMQLDTCAIIAGNTASGKTSALNALLSFIPPGERILAVEETPELSPPHEHFCRLVANAELGMGMPELVADSLRMRPDRVVVGEVRTPEEARGLFDSMTGGQARGCFATMHARSSTEALARLRSLGVPEHDLLSLDLLVVLRRAMLYSPTEKRCREARRCVEISEVGKDGARPVPIFALRGGKLVRTAARSLLMERAAMDFGMAEEGIGRLLRERERFLSSMPALNHYEAVQRIWRYAYGYPAGQKG